MVLFGMKRRITYITDGHSPFTPEQAQLSNNALSVRSVKGAKQDRLTFAFDELPAEIWQVLKACRALHIRWATERPYNASLPFSSRVSPGLHILYTPIAPTRPTEHLCPLLKKVFGFGLNCVLPEISFSRPSFSTERVASTLQFYSQIFSLTDFITYIQQTICASNSKCESTALTLRSADSVDIDYDSESHSLTLSVYWSQADISDGWHEDIQKEDLGSAKTEIGILAQEQATDLEYLSLGGFLGVVGEDKKLKPTLFSFPSRHQPLSQDAAYNVSFEKPTGLHPTLQISIPKSSLARPTAPSDSTCALHTYLTLPSMIFADKYQLSTSDDLFLRSHNLVALRSISGETDLEAPDWVVPQWGSSLLLDVATPPEVVKLKNKKSSSATSSTPEDWNITVPLHLRYLEPAESGHRIASMPWPVVFWACSSNSDELMAPNPFDRKDLGWDNLFSPRTTFFHLHPSHQQTRLVEDIEIPVLSIPGERGDEQARRAHMIELGTVVVIVLGFVWILWRLGIVVRSDYLKSAEKVKEKKEK